MKEFDDISTDDVLTDLRITQEEAESFEIILNELRKHPQQNRVRIYLDEGHLRQRQSLIEKLQAILDYRKAAPTWNKEAYNI